MTGKYTSFIKDLILFTLSTFLPKAISFFLVPVYTNCLTTAEYGIADLVSTTVGLMVPVATLNISDAVMRFTIENKNDAKPFAVGFVSIVKGILLVSSVVFLNMTLNIVNISSTIALFFLCNFIFVSIYGLCISYIRATDKVALLSIVSVLTSFITIASNIITLIIFKAGLNGYLFSGCIGYAIADLIMLWRIRSWNLIWSTSKLDVALRREMLIYSMPLIAANIAWWINSSSDRYILTAIRGVNENGIYSVAYKIPTILQMMQGVFSQAWLLSVFREYKKDNGPNYVSKVFELYYVAMGISCSVLIVLDIPLAKILYAKDFFEAWRYVPVLLISVVFISNAGFFESILTLHKRSKHVALTTVIGALVNTLLNLVMIYYIGAMGAAIATVCGYFVMWITRIRMVLNDYYFYIDWKRIIITYSILFVEAIVMIYIRNYLVCIVLTFIIVGINFGTIKVISKQVYNKVMTFWGN